MKCRTCGNEMELTQTDSGKIAICHTCKIKRKLVKKEQPRKKPAAVSQSYSNIPKEAIRSKSEREVKHNYQQMLDAGNSPDKSKRKKKKSPVLRLMLILLILVILGAAAFFGYRYYRNHIAGSGQTPAAQTAADGINVSTSDFSVEYWKHELSNDQSGNPCLLFYYIYTNNRKDVTANALSDVKLTAFQNNNECSEVTLASQPEEVANMTVNTEYNESITVCQVFSLSDTSDVTISVADVLASDSSTLGTQVFSL